MSSFLNWVLGTNKEKTPNQLYKEIEKVRMSDECSYVGECSQREIKVIPRVLNTNSPTFNSEAYAPFYPPIIICHADGGMGACQRHKDSKNEKLRKLAKEYLSKIDDAFIGSLPLDMAGIELEI